MRFTVGSSKMVIADLPGVGEITKPMLSCLYVSSEKIPEFHWDSLAEMIIP